VGLFRHVVVGISLLLLWATREHGRTLDYHVLVHLSCHLRLGFLDFGLWLAAHSASSSLPRSEHGAMSLCAVAALADLRGHVEVGVDLRGLRALLLRR
jgi:hypothetical protein